MSSIGPQIPAHLIRKTEEEEEEEDAYAPELPPDFVKKTETKPEDGDEEDDDDDDDDDEIGPKPIRRVEEGVDDDPVRAFMERESRRRKAREEEESGNKTKKLQREEWMLVPPSSSSLLGSIDQPGKVKARQFSRNSGSGRNQPGDYSLWTETPAEKQARIKDEVEGKRKRATDVDVDAEDVELRDNKRSKETKELVESYNREVRGKTLLEMHQSKTKKDGDDDDDEPAAIWDRERDMSIGGRLMDERQRSRMIQDARGLSSRFSKGKGQSGYL